ncbi:MAG TPA: hypothetical protein VJM50_24765 [Pyrinomonadaceae bacterium]|nr:hypothetical protein [Pyrinomonadaceae bacterium]
MNPCETMGSVGHLILAVFNGLTLLLTAFLAHRRKLADTERRAFEEMVLRKLKLSQDEIEWYARSRKRANGR